MARTTLLRSHRSWSLLLLLLVTGTACERETEREETDGPDRALAWRQLAWRDENGVIPKGALQTALADRERNLAHWATQTGPQAGGISPLAWTERGPFNIGGRTRALIVHPTLPNRLFAGAAGGGIWRSENAGVTWDPVDDKLARLAVCALAFDPTNPNVVYAGTGEGYFNGDGLSGDGLFKSTDGGTTFARLPATAGWDNVCRIAVHATNPQIVLVGKRYGGIQRSTDGGATWTNPLWAQGGYQVVFDPNNPNHALASLIDWNGSNWFHRVVYSRDAGATWTTAASGLQNQLGFDPRIEVAYAKSAPNVVYASCAAGGGKVWKSTDGGVNWTMVTTSGASGSSWYACPIWVDPTNANVLLVAGYHTWRSTNGGQTLTQCSDGYILTSQVHPDVHFFAHDPRFDGTTNKRLYVCCDGGVHRTDDVYAASTTSGWTSLQARYRATQFYGAAGDGTSGRIVGGTQDNGTQTLNSGAASALLTYGGDGGFCAIDPSNPLYLYGEYINLLLNRSTNGGASAADISAGIGDAGSNANFIAPFILDPNNPNTLLAGGRSLWRSTNVKAATPSWSAIRSAGSDNISAIAVAPGNSAVIWVGLNNGEVWKTSNGTAAVPTWTAVDDNSAKNPLPNRYVTRLFVDASDGSKAYAALGGWSSDNLWRTVDGGTNWTRITGSGGSALPAAPIRGFTRHPSNASWLYVGTEVGVFASEDAGVSWSTSNEGPTNASVDELTFMANSTTLLAATHGRGLWTAVVRPTVHVAYGTGCAGSNGTPQLVPVATLPPRLGAVLGVQLYQLRPSTPCFMVLGGSKTLWGSTPLPLDLGFLQMPGCSLLASLDLTVPFTANPLGAATWTLLVPNQTNLVGGTVYLQTLALDPAANLRGITVSNASQETVGW